MKKFNEIYNKIISEWNLFSKDKTQLKMYWDEADELMSRKDQIEKYIDYSANIYAIYLHYVAAEDIHPYSIDEMFLDVTRYLKLSFINM